MADKSVFNYVTGGPVRSENKSECPRASIRTNPPEFISGKVDENNRPITPFYITVNSPQLRDFAVFYFLFIVLNRPTLVWFRPFCNPCDTFGEA